MYIDVLWFQDSDVHAEAQNVLNGSTSDDNAIIIKNLVKVGHIIQKRWEGQGLG